jgi:predicted RNA-binding Zn-ribbon protein involved in translation (DUF1610 family)
LIFEDIDKRKNTVGLSKALDRVQAPEIGGMILTESEHGKLGKLIELRNKITHSEFELTDVYAEAKFFESFAFIIRFFAQHLDTEIEGILSKESLSTLLAIRKASEQLAQQALARIEAESGVEDVWVCPDCGYETFVLGADTCYTCRYQGQVSMCPECKGLNFEESFEDISDEWEICDEEAGVYTIHNDYGFPDRKVCEECAPKIRAKIREMRYNDDTFYDEEYWRMMQG